MPVEIRPEVAQAVRLRLDGPIPCDAAGYELGEFKRPAWTPQGFLRRGDRYILTCRACGEAQDAPLQALVDRGQGDRPMHLFRWRCPGEACRSGDVAVSLDLRRD